MDFPVLEATGLTKRFGKETALDALDLEIGPGQIFGFLGPNGAGKSTAIRLFLGLLKPTRGQTRLFGIDPGRDQRALQNVGALVEAPALYPHLTGAENLDIARIMLGLPKTEIGRVLEIADLTGATGKLVKNYSLGMKQRLAVARALLGDPGLIILDEPTNGMDPHGVRDMRALIRSLPETSNATVLVSSHILSEIEQTATHIGLLKTGRLVFSGSLAEMRARKRPRLVVRGAQPEAILSALTDTAYDAAPMIEGEIAVFLDADQPSEPQAADINRRLNAAGVEVHHLALERESLETLFMSLTGGDDAPKGGAQALKPVPEGPTLAAAA